MDAEVSREDIRSRVEQILSAILSDKYEAKITIKFRDKQENAHEQKRGNQVISGHSTDARKRARRTAK